MPLAETHLFAVHLSSRNEVEEDNDIAQHTLI